MKGWTRRLGRSKSSSSEKNRKNSQAEEATQKAKTPEQSPPAAPAPKDSGFSGFGRSSAPSDIRPEAFDMSNTGVSSRRTPSNSSGSRDSLAAAMPSKRRSSSNKDLAGHVHSKPQPSKQSRSSIPTKPNDLKINTRSDGARSPSSPASPLHFSPTSGSTSVPSTGITSDAANGAFLGTAPLNPASPVGGPVLGGTTALGGPGLGDAADLRGSARRGSLDRIDGLDVPQRHNSSRLEVSAERQLEQLPSFDEVSPHEHMDLFFAKIDQCNVMFNFSDPGSDARGKEIKRIALCELIDFASTSDIFLGGEHVYDAVFGMFSRNIIRSIPPPKNPFGEIYDPDDDEPVNVDAWPHMSLVYEFFLRFIDAPDLNVAIARQYVDQPFILSLLELFDSEDPRERDFLKTTLHRVYGKFLGTRPFIRRSINNVFLQFIYETGRFNGVAELLEIFGSIINGFAIPLKEEHKVFLSRVLLPLHTTRSLGLYHSHLTYCVVQFLEKDPHLTQEVVMGLLRYWPKVSSPKEVLFLLELEDIFEAMEPDEFTKVEVPVFHQLARCISSPHGQVAERALCNWTHEYFSTMVADNSEVILPILFPALCENSGHWNRTIHSMVHSATKMFLEANPMLYEKCAAEYREHKLLEKDDKALRQHSWEEVERMAQQRLAEKRAKAAPGQAGYGAGSAAAGAAAAKGASQADFKSVEASIKSHGNFSVLPSVSETPHRRAASSASSSSVSGGSGGPGGPGASGPTAVTKDRPSQTAIATAVTTQKRPTSSAAPSSIPGLQYNKKSPVVSRPSSFVPSIDTRAPDVRGADPRASVSPSTTASPASPATSLSPSSASPSFLPPVDTAGTEELRVPGVTREPTTGFAGLQSTPNNDDSSSSIEDEGFEDAPEFDDPVPTSPTASPFLVSCPSSPDN